MSKIRVVMLFIGVALLLAGAIAWAEECAPKTAPVEKIAISVKIEPNEARAYKVVVQMNGHLAGEDSAKPVDVDASATMHVLHKYGHREGDGLLPLEISAAYSEVTVDGEKLETPISDFPKLTLLLDSSWHITSIFGLAGTRYADQVSGLNYGNLISLFFVPDGDKPHAIGEKWSSKVKLPGSSQEVEISSSIKSVGEADGLKTVDIHQDWGWFVQKLQSGALTYSQVKVDSTFTQNTGKLLKSHAECLILYKDPAIQKQEDQEFKSNTKIDITPEKPATAPAPGVDS